MKKILIIFIVILFIPLALYSYYVEPNMLEVQYYTIQDKELSGLKIAFPSDFHIKPNQQDRLNKIVEIINNEKPDIVLSTGDFVSGHTKKSTMQIEDIVENLIKIQSKYGFYTVLGNHDSWYDRDRIKKALENKGINVLANNNISIDIDNKKLYIAGVEDKMTGKPDIQKALNGVKTPVIFLTHTPDMFPKVPEYVNLTLAGHTHGGQIRIPFAIFTASRYFNKYVSGYIVENNKKMIVTKGIGVSILPIRFNCKPEIVFINFE